MDLNRKSLIFSHDGEITKNGNFGDTILCLNSPGLSGSNTTSYRCSQSNFRGDSSSVPDDSCRLVLGLGPTPSEYCDDYYSFPVTKNKGLATALAHGFSSEGDSILQLGLSGGTVEASTVLDCSVSGETVNISYIQNLSAEDNQISIPIVDEGSTSAKKSGGYMPSLLFAPRRDSAKVSLQTQELLELGAKSQLNYEPSTTEEYSAGTISEQATTGTSSDHRTSNPKKCKFLGCRKGARGASGLCIGHGGGQRCQKPGCNKGAESRTAYYDVAILVDVPRLHEESQGFALDMVGVKGVRWKAALVVLKDRLVYASLMVVAAGASMRDVQRGPKGALCIARHMVVESVAYFKGAPRVLKEAHHYARDMVEESAAFLMVVGFALRVYMEALISVLLMVGERGVLCQAAQKVPVAALIVVSGMVEESGASLTAVEKVPKGAQTSARPMVGGKRCTWGEGKCEKFARGKSGLCAAHSSLVLERETSKGGLLGPGLFHGLVSAASTAGSSFDYTHSSSGVSVISDSIDSLENPGKRHLIPSEVLVPLSMKSSSSYSYLLSSAKPEDARNGYGTGVGSSDGRKSFDLKIPEGRVHGGALMSLFGGNLKNAIDGI
ncbi:hypothetical protein M0R45_026693 [Rubus argutus]|uniref:Uncharacterized protein n=1 Tax=Rubus argutus TaxID=59490 RepID=A0AAW1WZL3_RUBAR